MWELARLLLRTPGENSSSDSQWQVPEVQVPMQAAIQNGLGALESFMRLGMSQNIRPRQ
jgi:hypothetical protein